jgi:hypothetical protein
MQMGVKFEISGAIINFDRDACACDEWNGDRAWWKFAYWQLIHDVFYLDNFLIIVASDFSCKKKANHFSSFLAICQIQSELTSSAIYFHLHFRQLHCKQLTRLSPFRLFQLQNMLSTKHILWLKRMLMRQVAQKKVPTLFSCMCIFKDIIWRQIICDNSLSFSRFFVRYCSPTEWLIGYTQIKRTFTRCECCMLHI